MSRMRNDWPNGAEVAVSLTFDVDAESGWLGEDPGYATKLSTLSEASYFTAPQAFLDTWLAEFERPERSTGT